MNTFYYYYIRLGFHFSPFMEKNIYLDLISIHCWFNRSNSRPGRHTLLNRLARIHRYLVERSLHSTHNLFDKQYEQGVDLDTRHRQN